MPSEHRLSTDESSPSRPWIVLAVALLGLGVSLRAIHLGADPAYGAWAGYVTDEGRWTELARQLVLFGDPVPSTHLMRIHLLLAPLFQVAAAAGFAVAGVGLATARAVSVVCAGALLLTAFLWLRRHLTGAGLTIVLLTLAFQPDLFQLGRIAIPEMAAILFCFLSFATLAGGDVTRGRMFAAGLLTAAGLAFKGTTAPVVVIFAFVVLLVRRGDGGVGPGRAALAYLAGAVAPGLILLVPLFLVGGVAALSQLGAAFEFLTVFLILENPYGAVAGVVYSRSTPSVVLLLIPAWLIAGLLAPTRPLPRGTVRNLYLGSAIWAAGWLVVSSLLDYFPERYVFQALIPLALNLGAGLTLVRKIGLDRLASGLGELAGRERVATTAWLAIPLAFLLGSTLVVAGHAAGLELVHLREHLAVVGAAAALLTAGATLTWRADGMLAWMVGLPLVGLGLLYLPGLTGSGDSALWRTSGRGLELHLLALGVAAGFVGLRRHRWKEVLRGGGLLYGAVAAVVWISLSIAPYLAPTYTMRQAGRTVEAEVREGERVGSLHADGVMLATSVPYTTDLSEPTPEVLVVAFDNLRRYPELLERYRLERRTELNLGQRPGSATAELDPTIKVYRRIGDPPEP